MSGFPVTSSCESRVGIGVDEKFHVEHVADVGVVEHQNAFEQDHVRGIYHSKFTFHSENDIPKFVFEELKRMKSNLSTTTTFGTKKLWPLLTGSCCSEVIYVRKAQHGA